MRSQWLRVTIVNKMARNSKQQPRPRARQSSIMATMIQMKMKQLVQRKDNPAVCSIISILTWKNLIDCITPLMHITLTKLFT